MSGSRTAVLTDHLWASIVEICIGKWRIWSLKKIWCSNVRPWETVQIWGDCPCHEKQGWFWDGFSLTIYLSELLNIFVRLAIYLFLNCKMLNIKDRRSAARGESRLVCWDFWGWGWEGGWEGLKWLNWETKRRDDSKTGTDPTLLPHCNKNFKSIAFVLLFKSIYGWEMI